MQSSNFGDRQMLHRTPFIFFFVCICFAIAEAQSRFDSLMNLANKADHDTLRIFFMNEASVAIRESDNEQALSLATQANRKAQQLGYKRGVAKYWVDLLSQWHLFAGVGCIQPGAENRPRAG